MEGAPVSLRELNETNRDEVLALAVAPEQIRFVGSVADALLDTADYPGANPWYRAVYAGDEPVGFVMLSWNCVPQPPEIIGPWFLWKLLIDQGHQGHGYGGQVVRIVSEVIWEAGADELFTSCHADVVGSPAPFYARLGFVPTGDFDDQGETILRLDFRDP